MFTLKLSPIHPRCDICERCQTITEEPAKIKLVGSV